MFLDAVLAIRKLQEIDILWGNIIKFDLETAWFSLIHVDMHLQSGED